VQGGTDDLGVLPAGPGRLVTGELPDPGDHRCHPAGLDAQPLGDHPVLHRGVAGGGEAPGGLPQAFQHADEAGHGRHGDVPGGGPGNDLAQLDDGVAAANRHDVKLCRL
jgi:hypothetical protein